MINCEYLKMYINQVTILFLVLSSVSVICIPGGITGNIITGLGGELSASTTVRLFELLTNPAVDPDLPIIGGRGVLDVVEALL